MARGANVQGRIMYILHRKRQRSHQMEHHLPVATRGLGPWL